jgi:adhesin transport system outer membrane protein
MDVAYMAWNRSSIKSRLLMTVCLPFLCYSPITLAKSLQELVTTAITNHPSIQSALAQTKAAEQEKKSALWQFYPTPSIGAQTAVSNGDNPNFQGDAMVFTIGIDQPIWQGGRRFAEYNQAKIDIKISKAKMVQVQYDIAFELIDTYGKWLAAHMKLEAYEISIEKHEKLLNRVENRAKIGVSNHGDIDLALSRLEATKSLYLNAQFEESSAVSSLIELINEEITSDQLAQNIKAPITSTDNFNTQLEKSLSSHPGMHLVRLEAQKAEKAISSSKASLWPDVSLRIEQQVGHFAIKDSPSSTTLLLGIKSQFGAGLSAFSDIKSNTARLRSSKMDVESKKRQIKQTVVESHISERSLRSRIKAAGITLDAAEKVFDSYSRQFLAGRKSWLELMNSLREMTADKVELADLSAALVVTSSRLDIYVNGLSAYFANPKDVEKE